ncbi:MarR family winged helix-turn-helix transcriptional regulator [Kordiimonas laminariae]|uniref:MarR family winged helix-turn-helix transcriptional regulator n=1 Tax=Kordiimonas laminariae TaxID=2917717 RepID=UPI0031BBAE92
MTLRNYIDSHALQRAFIANQLNRLADLISDQGEVILEDAGIVFPARATSTVLLIGERGGMSAADIGNILEQPHQLVTQRIELLIKLNIAERVNDPSDGRRKVIQLTSKGQDQFRKLQIFLKDAEQLFTTLFQELGYDLTSIAQETTDALNKSSLRDRMRSIRNSG